VAENGELKAQLARLESKLADLAPRPVASAPADGLALSDAQPNLGNTEAMIQKITENVLGAVNPVLEEVRQEKASAKVAGAQQNSFNRAAQAHPELRNPDSEMFQTFSKIWDNRPDLQQVEGSPELIAEAALGLLSSARVGDQARKMAAAADKPTGPRNIDTVNDDAEIATAIDTLTNVGKSEGWNEDEFGDFLTLKFKQFGRTGK
jgi:hypothetical protein